MKKKYINISVTLALLVAAITLSALKYNQRDDKPNAGLITSQGFTAVKLIEGIGKVRHIAITQNGNIYARLARPVKGQCTLLLEQNGGKATVKMGFFASRGQSGKGPQLIEVTKDKIVVWVLHAWQTVGDGTALQVLDDPGVPEIPGQSER